MKDFLSSQLKHTLALPITQRALHTAWQAALVVLLLSDFSLDKATLGAAIGAGLSAFKTALLDYLNESK